VASYLIVPFNTNISESVKGMMVIVEGKQDPVTGKNYIYIVHQIFTLLIPLLDFKELCRLAPSPVIAVLNLQRDNNKSLCKHLHELHLLQFIKKK
jgi:hypothetical protein